MQDKHVKELNDTSTIYKIIAYITPFLGFLLYFKFNEYFELIFNSFGNIAIPLYIIIICVVTIKIYEKGIKYSWMANMLQEQIDINSNLNTLIRKGDNNESSGI